MKQSFTKKLAATPFDDPFLFVRVPHQRGALLFDLGDIRTLSPSEIFSITDVFVTHMHMDHFIGFDLLLRVCLRRESPINIYGPPPIASCVAGKLRGYAWNLIKSYPTRVNVFSFDGRTLRHYAFSAAERFRRCTVSVASSDGVLHRGAHFTVRALRLDHGTACLAYALEEDFRVSIDRARLAARGLTVGPWLTQFKGIIRTPGAPRDETILIDGLHHRAADIADIARISKGEKIVYATDLALTGRNEDRLVRFAGGADALYCEAYYREQDRALARERYHLTAEVCGRIARLAGVRNLSVIHISPKYRDERDVVIEEAMRSFRG